MGNSKYLDKDTQGCVENLEKYFTLGKESIDWYKDAKEFCESVATTYKVDVDVVAAVVAVLSPAIRWDYNMAATTLYVEAYTQGNSQPIVGGYGFNRNKAWRILHTRDVTLVSGMKVTPFFRSIVGYDNDVAVDRHAIRAWLGIEHIGGKGNGYGFPKSVHAKCADDYRTLAQIHNVSPAQAQAAVWIGYQTVKTTTRTRKVDTA